MENIQQDVQKYIKENFLHGVSGQTLDPDDSFMEKGIIDSTGILELVGFIEKKYGFKIQDEEVTPDNLDTVARVVAFIGRKLQAPHAGGRTAI